MTRLSGPPYRDIGSEISRWLALAMIVFCATEGGPQDANLDYRSVRAA